MDPELKDKTALIWKLYPMLITDYYLNFGTDSQSIVQSIWCDKKLQISECFKWHQT